MTGKKRGRPPVDEKVKQELARLLDKFPALKPEDLERRLLDKFKAMAPAKSTIKKLLPEIRKRAEKFKELNQPWSMGALVDTPIDPETVPFLVRMQADVKKMGKPITVGEARWLAFLLSFRKVREEVEKREIHGLVYEDFIRPISLTYYLRERVAWLTSTQPDTSDLDEDLNAERYDVFIARFPKEFCSLAKIYNPNLIDEVKQGIQNIHKSLGIPVNMPIFTTDAGYLLYHTLIGSVTNYKKWDTLSDDEKKALVIDLQNEVRQSETTSDFELPERYLQLLEGVK